MGWRACWRSEGETGHESVSLGPGRRNRLAWRAETLNDWAWHRRRGDAQGIKMAARQPWLAGRAQADPDTGGDGDEDKAVVRMRRRQARTRTRTATKEGERRGPANVGSSNISALFCNQRGRRAGTVIRAPRPAREPPACGAIWLIALLMPLCTLPAHPQLPLRSVPVAFACRSHPDAT